MVRRHPFVVDELIPVDHLNRGRCAICGLPPDNNRWHGEIPDDSADRYEVDREARQ